MISFSRSLRPSAIGCSSPSGPTRFGPSRTWSVSRLNAYGKCPALFFGQSVLGLEPRADPEEGLDARQRGSLL
ncbi:MAG: PD-(D/E)XK nuclease family protein, partial [Burkholderiales bacterium]